MIVDIESESFVDVNPAACELLGYSRAELLKMDPASIHPEDFDRVREEFIRDILEEGTGFTDDLHCLKKNGQEIPTEISGAALDPAPDGERSNRMIAILRDISDRIARRQELQAKVERLDRFARVVSHDLRNPLSVIRANVELARQNDELERLDKVNETVDRMDDMMTSLLQLAKEGNTISDTTKIDLEDIARKSWDGTSTDEATLAIESSVSFQADPERLREVLDNFFRNAIDHNSSPISISVGAIERESVNGFYVADNGPGIPEAQQDDIFDWGETSVGDGTGFGLAIVTNIVEAHGWEISVTDSGEDGTRFEIIGIS
ncbi:PAS/PAC sensor signal transduction histidine kinase [Halosimplex carlsbadense 2-9-1]|uniref:histidine kinase n=2 Tax=Halosimplex carlsbadense TaxID=171164 RepID=M0CCU0_9EURY|nr:PAS/PAC sensor signal transduction histidine kinase [Halosimplex carlsbadense 2-9-1]